MPRTTTKTTNVEEALQSNIRQLNSKISSLTDRLMTIERDLQRTQNLIKEDMKNLVEMVESTRT
jgi:molecular chaperone GrpE (heat shock protein)